MVQITPPVVDTTAFAEVGHDHDDTYEAIHQSFGLVAIGNSGATPTVDFNTARTQSFTLDQEGVAFALTNLVDGESYALRLQQGAGGSKVPTFSAAGFTLLWEGGAYPTWSTAEGAVDIVLLRVMGAEVICASLLGVTVIS